MIKTAYTNLKDVNNLQEKIVNFISERAKTEKTPISQKEVVLKMKDEGVKVFTTVNALNSLLKKGYIRRSVYVSNKTFYVLCRTI
jgi:Fe2+ or Zn2+ uptake regulation protein